MYVAVVPNRSSPPAMLLREACREQGKVKNRTLANISHWPPEQIEALRLVLKGNTTVAPRLPEAFDIVRSLPHGNVATVLGMIRQLKLDQLLQPGPQRGPVLALIAQRVLQPGSKLVRVLKSVELEIRPIHHRLADRVRAHILICLLAYYVEWHLRRALAPVLFEDEQRGAPPAPSPVAPAPRSASALAKARTKRTPDNLPVQSFRDLLRDLATIVKNRIQPTFKSIPSFDVVTPPTPVQQRALELIGVTL